MSRASAFLAGLTALVLVLVVGNPKVNQWLSEQLSDRVSPSRPSLSLASTRFLSWDVFGNSPELRVPMIVQVVGFVLLAAVLGGLAGRATRLAGLIGGFGAGVAAAIVASTIATLVTDQRFVAPVPSPSLLDRLSFGIARGAFAGLLPALLVAGAVAVGARPAARRTTAAVAYPPPGPSDPARAGGDPGPPAAPAHDRVGPAPGAAPVGEQPAGTEPTPAAGPGWGPGDETRSWRPSAEVEEALRETEASAPARGPAIGDPPPRPGGARPPSTAPPSAPDDHRDPDATQRLPPRG